MTKIIAEIAQAHEGSLGIAHSYIDALADCGVDVVKFQTHIAEAESSDEERFRVNFSYEDKTRNDYWRRMEFTFEQWAGLKQHCEDRNIEFMSSPFSIRAVELLEKLNVKSYKIGSGELSNYLMLQAIAQTSKPIILSSGMSDWKELDDTLGFLKDFSSPISLLQCTTSYPTKPEQWGLDTMVQMMSKYDIPVGFSDHSGDIFACLSAVALGAQIIEFHAVFHHQMFGPDAKASMNISQIQQLVQGVRQINRSFENPINKDEVGSFVELKRMFGKSLAVNQDLPVGHQIEIANLESKKPGDKGVPAKEFQKVIGKRLKSSIKKYDFLTYDILE